MNKREPISFFITGASLSHTNRGINAFTRGTIQYIHNKLPNARINIFDNGITSKNFRLDKINSFPLNINSLTSLCVNSFLWKIFPFLREFIEERAELIKEIRNSNRIICLNGGDSFSDIYGLKRISYLSAINIFALLLDKKYVFFPQTIGPFNARLSKRIAGFILKKAEHVYVREEYSEQIARKILPRDKVTLTVDMAFLMNPDKKKIKKFIKSENIIGINISGLLYSNSWYRKLLKNQENRYRKLIRELITYFVKEKKLNVMLIPHDYKFKEIDGGGDDLACKAVYKDFKDKYPSRISMVNEELNEKQIKGVISACDFFIGSRMHACIAAISTKVPTCPIAYSHKFKGIMKTINLESAVCNLKNQSNKEIINQIKKMYKERKKIKNKLKKTIPRIIKQTMEDDKL